jgi:DNA-binding LacI/PurR family transcriptional regulator
VINGVEKVKPDTRKKVDDAIIELGYQPNAIARSMAQGKSCMLASIAPNLVDFTFASNYEGAEFEARQAGYFMVTTSAPTETDFEILVDELIGHRRVDGVLVFNPYLDRRHKLLPRDLPLVYCSGRARDDIRYSVHLDNHMGAEIATRHLLELGHTSIGEITGPLVEDCAQERHQGYKSALVSSGINPKSAPSLEGDWSATSGYQIFMQWYKEKSIPSAVVAQNDRMAIGVISAAREKSIRVPEDLSVIGFDDMPLSSYFCPPLTTIRQDTFMLGREAVRLLLQIIEDPKLPPQHRSFPCELINRKSTAVYKRR